MTWPGRIHDISTDCCTVLSHAYSKDVVAPWLSIKTRVREGLGLQSSMSTVQGNNYFGTLYLGLDPVRPWRLSLYDWVMYESNYR